MRKLLMLTVAALIIAATVATTAQAHRLHWNAPNTHNMYKLHLSLKHFLIRDKHHVDMIRWREHRKVKSLLHQARHSASFPAELSRAIYWHKARYWKHKRWFHQDSRRITTVNNWLAIHSGWNSSNLALIPGVPYSFAACVALRESTNGQASSDVYGILPVSTWGNVSLAAQKRQFAHMYALYGASPWRPYDGC